MQTLSVSEIQRNLQNLNDFDVLKVVDKKRNIIKGYFLDSKYKDIIEEIIKKKQEEKKQLFGIVGVVKSNNAEISVQKLRDNKLSKYE